MDAHREPEKKSWQAICSPALFWAEWKLRMAPAQAQALCLCARVTLACRRAMPAIKEGTRGMSVFAVPASAEVWAEAAGR